MYASPNIIINRRNYQNKVLFLSDLFGNPKDTAHFKFPLLLFQPTPASSTSVGAGRSPSSKSVSPRGSGGTVARQRFVLIFLFHPIQFKVFSKNLL